MPLNFPVPPTTDYSSQPSKSSHGQEDVSAFRNCYQRFQQCLEYRDWQNSTPVSELIENYLLDFTLAAKRAMSNQPSRYRLFQLRYLEGLSRQDCCKALNLQEFSYASEIIQIERALGRTLTQRGLFPLHTYFHSNKLQLQQVAA